MALTVARDSTGAHQGPKWGDLVLEEARNSECLDVHRSLPCGLGRTKSPERLTSSGEAAALDSYRGRHALQLLPSQPSEDRRTGAAAGSASEAGFQSEAAPLQESDRPNTSPRARPLQPKALLPGTKMQARA